MIHAILPAAGNAERMRRLPKFLLPSDNFATTLIEKHVEMLTPLVDVIWLPTRPDLINLIHDLNFGEKVIAIPMATKTMSETVLRTCDLSSADKFILGMPDTAFTYENPYQLLDATLNSEQILQLGIWKTRPEQRGKVGAIKINNDIVVDSIDKDSQNNFGQHWGIMKFNRNFLLLLSSDMPHPGYAINPCIKNGLIITSKQVPGEYFDCGTFEEYKSLLNYSK